MEEKIKKKLEELKQAKQKMIAQVNAINGAIQACEELLKPDEEVKEVTDGPKN